MSSTVLCAQFWASHNRITRESALSEQPAESSNFKISSGDIKAENCTCVGMAFLAQSG